MENERFTVVFHADVWQTTLKNSTKMRAARATRLFFLIQPIRSSSWCYMSLPPPLLKFPVSTN